MTQVAPSLLSADFGHLAADIEMLNDSDAAMLHLDVMDGRFVPNISFGFPVIEAIAKLARKPLDAHLMIVEPDRWVSRLRDCGCTWMNFHAEAETHIDRLIHAIKDAGMRAAVTLNPATPVSVLEEIAPELDMVLLMSVNPGFGGQKFIERTVDKTRKLRSLLQATGSRALIEVDGGVNLSTGRRLVDAAADVRVAGSYVFNSENPRETIHRLSLL